MIDTDSLMDVELVNLSWVLFAEAHVTAPLVSESELFTPAVPMRTAARAQARRARRASRIVGVSAVAALLVGGIAAASQAPPGRALHPEAVLAAAPTVALVHARGAGGAFTPRVTPPDVVESETIASAALVCIGPYPDPRPTPRRVELPAAPRLVLPVVVPTPIPLVAFAARPAEMDRGAAAITIAAAARSAAACLEPGDVRRSMSVRVTFAPAGRATSATVTGGPFAGTAIGACVARALRGAHVGAFEGEPVAVSTTVRL
jgi:hypothetical protein